MKNSAGLYKITYAQCEGCLGENNMFVVTKLPKYGYDRFELKDTFSREMKFNSLQWKTSDNATKNSGYMKYQDKNERNVDYVIAWGKEMDILEQHLPDKTMAEVYA